jgi:hypothetical protein
MIAIEQHHRDGGDRGHDEDHQPQEYDDDGLRA